MLMNGLLPRASLTAYGRMSVLLRAAIWVSVPPFWALIGLYTTLRSLLSLVLKACWSLSRPARWLLHVMKRLEVSTRDKIEKLRRVILIMGIGTHYIFLCSCSHWHLDGRRSIRSCYGYFPHDWWMHCWFTDTNPLPNIPTVEQPAYGRSRLRTEGYA